MQYTRRGMADVIEVGRGRAGQEGQGKYTSRMFFMVIINRIRSEKMRNTLLILLAATANHQLKFSLVFPSEYETSNDRRVAF